MFLGVEAAFRRIPGILSTEVGYTGGHKEQPTYQEVCTGTTGHAEAVNIVFNPDQVSYDTLLSAFWQLHDPTTLNRQGPDIGSQYRSAIFFHTPQQEAAAKASQEKFQAHFSKPIVTELVPAVPFYRAEEYHQQYAEKHGHLHC